MGPCIRPVCCFQPQWENIIIYLQCLLSQTHGTEKPSRFGLICSVNGPWGHLAIMENGMLGTSMLYCQRAPSGSWCQPAHPSYLWLINKLGHQEGSHLWATCTKSPMIASFIAGHYSHVFQCFHHAHYLNIFNYFLHFLLFLSLFPHLSVSVHLLCRDDGWGH